MILRCQVRTHGGAYSPRMRTLHYPILTATLFLVAGQAHATDLVSIDWSPTGAFERELPVPAGKFAEACGKLAAQSAVAWHFEADAALDFNIHYHEGEKVVYPARLAGASEGKDTLKAEAPQDYCWMWSNKTGKDVRLKLSLQKR